MRYILALAAMGVGLVTLGWQLTPSLETAKLTLSIDEDDLNLGTIWAQKELQWTIRLRNIGSEAIEVFQLSSNCQCTSISPEAFVIPASESREIALTLDVLTPQSAPTSSVAEKTPFAVDLFARIASSSPRQIRWTLSGFVRSPVYFSVPELFFGEEANEPTPVHNFEMQSVDFTSVVPIRAADVEITPPDFATANIQLETPMSGVLKVTPSGSLEEGPFCFNLIVNVESLDSEVLPSVSLPVRGVCVRDVYADPPLVMAGPKPIGETINATITIRSRSGRKLVVHDIHSATEGIKWDHRTREDSDSIVELEVHRQIEHVGLADEELSVKMLPDGGKTYDVLRIPLRYIGVAKGQTDGK